MAKRPLFTFPGKNGDALLQWPAAFHWWREHGEQFVVGISSAIAPLEMLFLAQPAVADVLWIPGIQHLGCGGQPWDFAMAPEDYAVWSSVNHMGFREHPKRQITRVSCDVLGIKVPEAELTEMPSISVPAPFEPEPLCLLHSTLLSHLDVRPRSWDVIKTLLPTLKARFKYLVAIGSPEEREMAEREWGVPSWDDGHDFLLLAEMMTRARLVIDTGSGNAALAGAMKVPCIRIHEAIYTDGRKDFAPDIWSNLGSNQLNWLGSDPAELIPFVEAHSAGLGNTRKSRRSAKHRKSQGVASTGMVVRSAEAHA